MSGRKNGAGLGWAVALVAMVSGLLATTACGATVARAEQFLGQGRAGEALVALEAVPEKGRSGGGRMRSRRHGL